MKVAVVAQSQRDAIHFAAAFGMTRAAAPLHAGVTPLLGYQFDRVVLAPLVEPDVRDEWWQELLRRNRGLILTTTTWSP